MSNQRLFIAVNLPEKIKKKLVDYQNNWQQLPVRWTPEDNLHITLVFIGSVAKTKTDNISSVCQAVAEKFSPFSLRLSKIKLGPPHSKARMFWVVVQKKEELIFLQKVLERGLIKKSDSGFNKGENRVYLPHITLGRINQKKWAKLEQKPKVEESLGLGFHVESVDLMKSKLKSSGAEYKLIQKFFL